MDRPALFESGLAGVFASRGATLWTTEPPADGLGMRMEQVKSRKSSPHAGPSAVLYWIALPERL